MDQEKIADVERDIANLNDDEYVAGLIEETKRLGDEPFRVWVAALEREVDELEKELRLKTKLREATLNLWAKAHNP